MSKSESKGQKVQKELDIILSRLNALEASTTDNAQKSIIGVLRVLAETQIHSLNELEHIKKGLDLLMMQIFKVENKVDSSL
ncbi:MAG TPA: hypothetical protein VJJ25_03010 [Nitrosopumilaceae archaeon]|nr:hypothetical protein [Nitrosopumilaceae archaeon]